jgi:2-oxoglutarate dehydrogenase E2 component (dihydrolipoamide succinyltransferase)
VIGRIDEADGAKPSKKEKPATTDGKQKKDTQPTAAKVDPHLSAKTPEKSQPPTPPERRTAVKDKPRAAEHKPAIKKPSSVEEKEERDGGKESDEIEESADVSRGEDRAPMSPIRRRIAARLVAAQQNAALLTTFNEIDMSAVKTLRAQHGAAFERRHRVKLGFMSFFVKATVESLRQCPELNAAIDGDEIVYRRYYDIGVAISTDKGLVVPVLRNAERMSFADIEKGIDDFATRGRDGQLKVEELQGGTFTITNGGVFGSLLSTPIVNPPQSGVLGMHAIQDRPVAIESQAVVRPMMYVALTYDHRIVDGREAVTFLKRIKETIEEPARLLIEV